MNDRTSRKVTKPCKNAMLGSNGKKSIGFRGFKIVNSNIKLVKQVEAKSSTKSKQVEESPKKSSVSSSQMEKTKSPDLNEAKFSQNRSTVDALRVIKERIQAKKKLLTESPIPNGIHLDAVSTTKEEIDKRLQSASENAKDSNQSRSKFSKSSKETGDCSPQKICNEKNFSDESKSGDKFVPPVSDDKKIFSSPSKSKEETFNRSRHSYSKSNIDRYSKNSSRRDNESRRKDDHYGKSHKKSKRDSGSGSERSPDKRRDRTSSHNKHSYDRYGKKRDYENEDHSIYDSKTRHSTEKHSESRKRIERSKSPYRDKDRRHQHRDRYATTKKDPAANRLKSPSRERDRTHTSKSHHTERDGGYHKEYINRDIHSRGYSDNPNSRAEKSQASKSDSRRFDSRNKHSHSENQHHIRYLSKSDGRSDERSSYSRKSSQSDRGRNDQEEVKSQSPRSSSLQKCSDQCGDKNADVSKDKTKRSKIDGGLFSKLSIAFSLDGEDADYEVEMSGSDEEPAMVEIDSLVAEPSRQSKSPSNSVMLENSNRHPGLQQEPIKNTVDISPKERDSASGEKSAENILIPMVVVDEVKTDSSECETANDRVELVASHKSNLDTLFNDESHPVKVLNGRNCLGTEQEKLYEQGPESQSQIMHTDVAEDTPKDCESDSMPPANYDIPIASPPTPLMDEPQDEFSFMSRRNRTLTEDVIPVCSGISDSLKTRHAPSENLFSPNATPEPNLDSHNESVTSPVKTDASLVELEAEVLPDEQHSAKIKPSGSDSCENNGTRIEKEPIHTQEGAICSDSVPIVNTVTHSAEELDVDCESLMNDILPSKTESLDVARTKLPSISSQLQTVYKSILETNFIKDSDDEDKLSCADLNGVISKAVDNVLNHEKEPCQSEVMKSPDQLGPDNESDRDSEEYKSQNVPDIIDRKHDHTELQVDPVLAVLSNIIHDVSVKTSQHKLKLHATTKTPLPAKKSYVQQVHPPAPLQCNEMIIDSTTSVSFSQCPHDELPAISNAGEIGSEHCAVIPKSSENRDKILPEESSLSRQDSSSSGANDNEEGPRRSARIRTKKSERSLKKCPSYEGNQIQSNVAPSIATLTATSDVEPIIGLSAVVNNNIPACALKDLSEEEIFKVKIRLASGTSDCPDRFHLLDENLYLTSVKKSRARKEIKRMVCDCGTDDVVDSEEPCGENCLNRLLMIECSSRCLYGSKCTNKRFQLQKYAPTEVFKTEYKGWGIRAAADIEPGELVMEYCGEVLNQKEFTKRSLEYSESNHTHFYFMALSQDEVIDATYKGNASRFINHSCDPNAETQKWTVNGRLRVGFFTVKSIKKGDEITFDYQFERYGKIAQKCYCGTVKCRGYLGKAPDENEEDGAKFSKLLSTEAFLGNEESDSPEKAQKRKKLSLFQDNTMERDLSKLKGGLQSTKDVLTLSRLMVRCDTYNQRSMCLEVLKGTVCQTWLKNFLKFHGLSILWSWMVDITSIDSIEASSFKLNIINTLCILPIGNKNIIEDSKVLSVVQRWAKPEIEETPESADVKTEAAKTEKNTEDSCTEKNDADSLKPSASEISTIEEKPCDDSTSKDAVTVDNEKQENMKQVVDTSTEKILEAAAKLLDCWKDLKEIYRIPKRQRPIPSPSQDSSSRTSSPVPKQTKADESDFKFSRTNAWRDGSLERWRDSSDRSTDGKFRDSQTSPGSNTSSENKREPGRRKRRFSTDSDDGSVPWHCKAPRATKISREEHRRKFEQDIEKKEQEKRRLEEIEADNARNAMINNHHAYIIDGMPVLGQELQIPGTTFTPGGVSGNLIQINPAPIMIDQFGQQVDASQPMVQQNVFHPQLPMQLGYNTQANVQGMFNPNFNSQLDFQDSYAYNAPNMQNSIPIAGMDQQQQMLTNHIGVVNAQTAPLEMQHIAQPTLSTVQPAQPSTSNVTILGTQNGQAIVMLSAEQLKKLTEGDATPASTSISSNESKKKTGKTKENDVIEEEKAPDQLPPNWKTATDPEGRVYYYHNITRETQWDPPKWKDPASTDKRGQATPTQDGKQTKEKEDGITDEARKSKDQFRLRMSQFVVQCLSSFRKPDRKVGRITSTEDFKHLARKLTHLIMQKELKQVQVWEDLDFNANVKHKTKEYVKKYMSKVGPVYRIKDDT